MGAVVRFERREHIGIITLDRPEARNAVNPQLTAELEAAVDELEGDDDLRVGLLTAIHGGEPPVFCAGADLKSIRTGHADDLQTDRGGFAGFIYRERTKPIVAAIDGLASSGGCEIALACDIVVASGRARFGLAEVRWNLVPAAGGLFRLPLVVGSSTGLDMILTGEPIDAARAHQLGLVSRSRPTAKRSARRCGCAARLLPMGRWRCRRAWRSRRPSVADETASRERDGRSPWPHAGIGGPRRGPCRIRREASAGVDRPVIPHPHDL